MFDKLKSFILVAIARYNPILQMNGISINLEIARKVKKPAYSQSISWLFDLSAILRVIMGMQQTVRLFA